MQVKVPAVPRAEPGRLEALLSELGLPPTETRDEDTEQIVERYEGLLEEIAALARRGLCRSFDSKHPYDPSVYRDVIAELCTPLGVRVTGYDDLAGALIVRDGDEVETIEIGAPEQDGDERWMDLAFVIAAVAAIANPRGWCVVGHADDLHDVLFAVVPDDVWRRILDEDLQGVLSRVDGDDLADADADLN